MQATRIRLGGVVAQRCLSCARCTCHDRDPGHPFTPAAERSVSVAAEGRRLDTVVRIRAASAMQCHPLFNDMIRPQQQWPRDREAERFGSLQVEDELEVCRLLHG
jgi:hypothetical protein